MICKKQNSEQKISKRTFFEKNTVLKNVQKKIKI